MANQTGTRNFLVPADGRTNSISTSFVASPNPYIINWDQFSVDHFKFYPQGCFIDNSAGTDELVITITPNNFKIVVGAGQYKTVQYPAPSQNQGASITGDGAVTIHWVDFPTFPDFGGSISLAYTPANPLPVAIPPGFSVNAIVPEMAPGGITYKVEDVDVAT